MQVNHFEFVLEARTPIAHHSETLGNEQIAMRRKVRQRGGAWADVPIITGDTMRHGMREAADRAQWRHDPVSRLRADVAAAGGRKARDAGESWESALSSMHAMYAREGRAHIVKVPTPALVMGRTTHDARGRTCFRASWAARTGADYIGTLAGGRSVVLEAKSSGDARIGIDAVRPHQAGALDQCHALGGLALVVVRLSTGAWVVPWLRWADAPAGRREKSLTAEDLDARGSRIDSARPDWMGAL